jgi:heparanase 1
VDEVTFHQYYFKGPGADAAPFVSARTLDSLAPLIRIATAEARHIPFAHNGVMGPGGASLGETASAYDGGTPRISDGFASTFGWVDKLGMAARLGLRRVFRQALCGGAYGLLQLDETTRAIVHTPDFWATLLWKKLMGGTVLQVAMSGAVAADHRLRAYAHCSAAVVGHVSVAVVNLVNTTVDVRLTAGVIGGGATPHSVDVYVLTTTEGTYTGHTLLINGNIVGVSSNGTIPDLGALARTVTGGTVSMPPLSVAFATWSAHPSTPHCAPL